MVTLTAILRNARSLIDDCSTRGIRLWVEGTRLEVAATPGTMTRKHLAMLKVHKAEVVRVLGPPDSPAAPPTPPAAPFDPAAFLDELFSRKVAVWVDDGGKAGPATLKHYDHDGVITPDDLAVLATQEEGIIAYLIAPPTPEESAAVEAEVKRLWAEADAGRATRDREIEEQFGIVESADYPVDRFAGLSPGRPLPWRSAMARWPVDARERWGRRANGLQGEGEGSGGLDWREAERAAFEEINGGPVDPVDPAHSSWAAERDAAAAKTQTPCPSWIDDPSLTFGSDGIRAGDGKGRQVIGAGGSIKGIRDSGTPLLDGARAGA